MKGEGCKMKMKAGAFASAFFVSHRKRECSNANHNANLNPN